MTRRSPARPSHRPASGPAAAAASGTGNSSSAACSGVMPCTSCSRWLSTSSTPTSVSMAIRATATPRLNPASRNIPTSIIGSAWPRWRRANSVIATAPTATASMATP
ncbi:Uncharacterised protein [Bordetella pertussis]|nr:Uncharacterised protein [Bordetella pertussis]